jgi:hypothetical protein
MLKRFLIIQKYFPCFVLFDRQSTVEWQQHLTLNGDFYFGVFTGATWMLASWPFKKHHNHTCAPQFSDPKTGFYSVFC